MVWLGPGTVMEAELRIGRRCKNHSRPRGLGTQRTSRQPRTSSDSPPNKENQTTIVLHAAIVVMQTPAVAVPVSGSEGFKTICWALDRRVLAGLDTQFWAHKDLWILNIYIYIYLPRNTSLCVIKNTGNIYQKRVSRHTSHSRHIAVDAVARRSL